MAIRKALPKLTAPRAAPLAVTKKLNRDEVYALVKRIPRGKVASYGQLAALLGMPRHARHVGNALGALPDVGDGAKVPWQRVVNSQGRISMRMTHWESGSEALQRILLEDEGVVFNESGAIDLRRYGWKP